MKRAVRTTEDTPMEPEAHCGQIMEIASLFIARFFGLSCWLLLKISQCPRPWQFDSFAKGLDGSAVGQAALKLMKEGNDRYCHGKPMAGKFDSEMSALNPKKKSIWNKHEMSDLQLLWFAVNILIYFAHYRSQLVLFDRIANVQSTSASGKALSTVGQAPHTAPCPESWETKGETVALACSVLTYFHIFSA